MAAFPAARRVFRLGGASPADHVRVFLAVTAVANVLLLGLIADGEERYVFLSVLLLLILGADAIARYASSWSAIVLAAFAAFAVLAAGVDYRVVMNGDFAVVTAEQTSLVTAAQEISGRHPCLVVTGFQPEMGWYSGCATTGFPQGETGRLPPGERVYVVLFQRGGTGQPHLAQLKKLTAGRHVTIKNVHTNGSLGDARIITLSSGPAGAGRDPAYRQAG